MKAILLYEHGGPEVLQYAEFDTPQPGYGEVQIALRAIAMNRLDIWTRNGWPGIRLEYPHILGADGAGVVSAVGPGVTAVSVGDRVAINPTISPDPLDENVLAGRDNMARRGGILGEDSRGTYAEYVVVPQQNLLKLPEGFPFEEAAAASLVFITAWHSLITRGGLRPGETVLIVGAGGGVNTASIQIARLAGATVYVVGSSDEKLERAAALGAHHLINRTREDWSRAVYEMTGRRGVDVVVDNVGAATWESSIRALARGGRMLVVGGTSGYNARVGVNYIFRKHISIIGSTMGTHADYRAVMGLLFEGKLKAIVGDMLPLKEVQAAHRRFEAGDFFGKLVLIP